MLELFVNTESPVEEHEKLKQYIIMERINPPMVKAWMLRDGNILEVDSLSELGCYSLLFLDTSRPKDSQILANRNFGTLMRTKGSHSNEGGVNSGFSVIDIPILYMAEKDNLQDKIKANVETLLE